VARWNRPADDIPWQLAEYIATGTMPPGWMGACLRWLADHPGAKLPFGEHGDATDVYRLARELRLD
jgi:hypothetical protein